MTGIFLPQSSSPSSSSFRLLLLLDPKTTRKEKDMKYQLRKGLPERAKPVYPIPVTLIALGGPIERVLGFHLPPTKIQEAQEPSNQPKADWMQPVVVREKKSNEANCCSHQLLLISA